MTLVSTVSVAAGHVAENEDAFALADGIGVVVDRAGLPKSLRAGCSHTVAWYADVLATSFCDRLQRHDTTMRAALAEAIADVRASHQNTCRLEEGSPSATVAAWRLTPDAIEYLVLCDASVILALRDGTVHEVTDDRIAVVTAPLIDVHRTTPAHRHAVDELRTARRAAVERTRNQPGGFWCCHTDPAAADEAIYGQVGRDTVLAVIAASDGATRGHQLLNALPIRELAHAVLSGDAPSVVERIRRAERMDDSLKTRAIKQHDDATLVAVVLEEQQTLGTAGPRLSSS